MVKRLALRTFIFAVLTLAAFIFMEPLTRMTGWPELMKGLTAAAVLAWAEISIMWIRIAMEPRIDVQTSAMHAVIDPRSSAMVYAAHRFTWAVRLTAFVFLYWA